MDGATAAARLERMVQASTYPELGREEVAELVELAKRPDGYGRAPDTDEWAGVYDLNAAAAEGWRWKAGKVAGDESVTADGSSFTADAYKGCLAMAKQYDDAPSYNPDAAAELSGSEYGAIGMVSHYDRLGLLGPNDVANAAELVEWP